jgi:hypothetical protein
MAEKLSKSSSINSNDNQSEITRGGERGDADMKGYLFKWTNYLKGYQKRYFVLSKSILIYFR